MVCGLSPEPETVIRSLVRCKEGHVRWREQCVQSMAVGRTAPSVLQPDMAVGPDSPSEGPTYLPPSSWLTCPWRHLSLRVGAGLTFCCRNGLSSP